jgi:hypothetical protein
VAKIITVESCWKCPYARENEETLGCGNVYPVKKLPLAVVEEREAFPCWCPLSDKEAKREI